MKKIFTILIATLLIGTTSFAQETEITVEKGQYLKVGNAEEITKVNVHNEQDKLIFENVKIENIDSSANVFVPLNNPLQLVYIHIIKDNEETVLKVNLTEPHEHQGRLVEFVRPTETEAGKMEYFICDGCGKCFEDKACTTEIGDVDTWSYLAPVPREQWGEGNPVPYIAQYDDKQVINDSKPNPTWTEEKIEEYYKQEDAEIQQELEERKVKSELVVKSNDDDKTIESELIVEPTKINETIEPVTFTVEPIEVEKELAFWEKIKEFFINLFN